MIRSALLRAQLLEALAHRSRSMQCFSLLTRRHLVSRALQLVDATYARFGGLQQATVEVGGLVVSEWDMQSGRIDSGQGLEGVARLRARRTARYGLRRYARWCGRMTCRSFLKLSRPMSVKRVARSRSIAAAAPGQATGAGCASAAACWRAMPTVSRRGWSCCSRMSMPPAIWRTA